MSKHQTPFVPSARTGGRIEGLAPTSAPVTLSAAKNLASPHLKARGVRLRACRILLMPGRSFSPAASYFLSTATRSNQEAPPRSLRRSNRKAIGTVPCASRPRWAFCTGHPWPVQNGFGILPRPRLHAAVPPRPVMLGAARRGGTSKAKATAASKAQPPHLRHSRAGGNPVLVVCTATTPPPNPLPQVEGGLKAGSGDAFDVAVPWTFPPSGCAEHRSPRRTGPRADAGRGRMPTISPTGHGWPVGETRRGREAQGTESSPSDDSAQTPGRSFFGYFLVAVDKKVTRHQGGTALSISRQMVRAQARTPRFQSAHQS